jgi:preprotein translocase subunit SecA
MFDFLKKLFGTKSEKDIKNLESKVEEINTLFSSFASLSNDALRARSAALKNDIQQSVKGHSEKIEEIRAKAADPQMDVHAQEEL